MGATEEPTRFIERRVRRSDDNLVPTLTVLEGPQIGAFFALDPGRRAHRIGRSEDADVHLPDPSVSRTHAICVVADLPGRIAVRIEDQGSTNGVLVNGRMVRDATLISGDKVRLGDILLRFEWLSEEEVSYHSGVSAKVRAGERDHLTGLLSRAFLDERLDRLLAEVEQRGQPLSCLLLDLDHFKEFNDVHGHLVGDAAIRCAAAALRDGLRDTDVAIRYGGEEFLVVMPGLAVDDAGQVATRVLERISGAGLAALAGGLLLTASAGLASRLPGEASIDWIARADAALYEAKRLGRNRVQVAQARTATSAASGEGVRSEPDTSPSMSSVERPGADPAPADPMSEESAYGSGTPAPGSDRGRSR